MDAQSLEVFRAILQPVITLMTALLLSGTVVAYATEFLKSDYVPVKIFNRFPRITAFVASVIATVVSVYTASFNLIFTNALEYAGLGVGIFIVSVIVYKRIVKGVLPVSAAPAVDKTVTPIDPTTPTPPAV